MQNMKANREVFRAPLNCWFKSYANYSVVGGNGFARFEPFRMQAPADFIMNTRNKVMPAELFYALGLHDDYHIDTDGKYIYVYNHEYLEEALAKTVPGSLVYDTSFQLSFVDEAKKKARHTPKHYVNEFLNVSDHPNRNNIAVREVKNYLHLRHENALEPGNVLVVFCNDGKRVWLQLSNISDEDAAKYIPDSALLGRLELTPQQNGLAFVTRTEKNGYIRLPNGFAKDFLGDSGLKGAMYLQTWMCGNTMIVEGIPYGSIRTTDPHKTITVCKSCK